MDLNERPSEENATNLEDLLKAAMATVEAINQDMAPRLKELRETFESLPKFDLSAEATQSLATISTEMMGHFESYSSKLSNITEGLKLAMPSTESDTLLTQEQKASVKHLLSEAWLREFGANTKVSEAIAELKNISSFDPKAAKAAIALVKGNNSTTFPNFSYALTSQKIAANLGELEPPVLLNLTKPFDALTADDIYLADEDADQ